jgi:hypothetical protein
VSLSNTVTFRNPLVLLGPARSAFRKPFVPPTPKTPVVVRSISYGGEEHPATLKRVIVVPVAHLPLKDDSARHSLKLIAGSRWTPTPPRDSGIGSDAPGGEHGYVKISCEDFPRPAMNLKWASDALDRLIEEANVYLRLSLVSERSLKPACLDRNLLVPCQISQRTPGTFLQKLENQRRANTFAFAQGNGSLFATSPKSGYRIQHRKPLSQYLSRQVLLLLILQLESISPLRGSRLSSKFE